MRKTFLGIAAAALSASLTLSACGANTASPAGGSGSDSGGGSEPTEGTIGVILPETATSARWESFDKPMLEEAINEQGYEAIIQNARGQVDKFATLADGMIAKGVEVLVIASINSKVGNSVSAQARNAGIPVIDYDRLNVGARSNYYVSFDNVRVGELQGMAMKKALADQSGAEVIEIEGAPTDNNATLFHKGQRNILQPLYDSGKLTLVDSRRIKNWDNQKGGVVFEQFLTANGGTVDGVVAANDGLAGAVITVLKKYGLAGKVPVTGQDATPAGLQAILRGDQYMTVFKEIKKEAEATAKLAAALAKGDKAAAEEIASEVTTDPETGDKVPSVLLEPQTITKENVATVVEKGYVEAGEICGGDLADTCAKLGIN